MKEFWLEKVRIQKAEREMTRTVIEESDSHKVTHVTNGKNINFVMSMPKRHKLVIPILHKRDRHQQP